MKTFVRWASCGRTSASTTIHLAVGAYEDALCGVRVVRIVDGSAGKPRRCPRCMRLYLATMTATDELVGVFDEMGRIKR